MEFIYPLSPDPDAAPAAVVGWHHNSHGPRTFPAHSHLRAQLMHVCEGVVIVEVEGATWVVPPLRAMWIPPGVVHSARYPRGVALRHLYLDMSSIGLDMPESCVLLQLEPLTKELIRVVAEQPWEEGCSERGKRRIAVLLDQVSTASRTEMHLPPGRDKRVARVMDMIRDNPADARPLEDLAAAASGSARTLARLFKRDTGLSFGEWRQQFRVQHAVECLACGDSIAEVSHRLGYGSSSAFATMFKQAVGVPPARYMRSNG